MAKTKWWLQIVGSFYLLLSTDESVGRVYQS